MSRMSVPPKHLMCMRGDYAMTQTWWVINGMRCEWVCVYVCAYVW